MAPTSLWACAAVLLVAVVSDVATRQIPNVVTLGGAFIGLTLHVAIGIVDHGAMGGLRGLGYGLVGAIGCGVIPFLAWRRGEMGGGDVKLFVAIGALVGPVVGFDIEALTFCISFVVLFPYRLVRHGAFRLGLTNMGIGLRNLLRERDRRRPYLQGPKMPPMILAPTIGLAFVFALVQHGVLR